MSAMLKLADKVRYQIRRTSDSYYERRFAVRTSQHINSSELGFAECMHDYSAIPYSAFFRAVKNIPVRGRVFLDVGAGLGRAVVCAATLPFERVSGFDLSEMLVSQGQANIWRASRHFRCTDVRLFVADATNYELPSDVDVIHFFNPFRGDPLIACLQQIKASLIQSPRPIHILFGNPWFVRHYIPGIIPTPWLKTVTNVRWPYHSRHDPDGAVYRIYQVNPGAA